MVLLKAQLASAAPLPTTLKFISNKPSVIPSSVVLVEAGQNFKTIGVQSLSVAAPTIVTISAQAGGTAAGFQVTVVPQSASSNPIVAENQLTGTPNWEPSSPSKNGEIQAYAGEWSIQRGGSIDLYVSTVAKFYDVDVFRLGYYNGLGGRLVYTIRNCTGVSQGYWVDGMQLPSNATTPENGRLAILHHIVSYQDRTGTHTEDTNPRDANWARTLGFQLPAALPTGIYLIRLTESATGTQWQVPFVIRDEASGAPLVISYPFYTDEVYNMWGGASGYKDAIPSQVHSFEVSFNRPFSDDAGGGNLRVWTYQFARYVEQQGFFVAYTTSNDISEGNTVLTRYKGFITAGHDEYWTQIEFYDAVQAMNSGVSEAFFGGNDIYEQVREEPDLSGHPNRFLACYKGYPDPATPEKGALGVTLNSTDWHHLGYSEEKLIRTAWVGFYSLTQPYVATNTWHWVYAGTSLADGSTIPNLIGSEANGVTNSAYLNIPGHSITILASSPYTVFARTGGTELAIHNAIIDEYPGGNFVFNAATIVWPLALTTYFPVGIKPTWGPRPQLSRDVMQITNNVLKRMMQ